MKRTAIGIACVLALCIAARAATPADAVAALRARDATYDDWKPILKLGAPAVPELRKLLKDPSPHLRAQAAVLLYRLGEAKALDALAALLASPDEAARKEATEGLLAFVGEPATFRPSAPDAQRAAALQRWNAWWKANREKALAQPPMKALYGKVLAADPRTGFVGVSLSGRHGLERGMTLQVRRGAQFVCRLEVVAAPAEASVTRIVELSDKSAPKPGDPVFILLR